MNEEGRSIVWYWKIAKALPLLAFILICVVLGEGLRMLSPFEEYEPQHVRVARKASEEHNNSDK